MGGQLRGCIERVTSGGYVEGWAVDANIEPKCLRLSVEVAGLVIAAGWANRFRDDLVGVAGTGWCGFRLRLRVAAINLVGEPLTLATADGGARWRPVSFTALVASAGPSGLQAALGEDPTVVNRVEELRGCEPLFRNYIAAHGVKRFLEAAYGYVLDRPAYEEDVAQNRHRLEAGEISAYSLIEMLCRSKEGLGMQRILAAPTQPGFPFLDV